MPVGERTHALVGGVPWCRPRAGRSREPRLPCRASSKRNCDVVVARVRPARSMAARKRRLLPSSLAPHPPARARARERGINAPRHSDRYIGYNPDMCMCVSVRPATNVVAEGSGVGLAVNHRRSSPRSSSSTSRSIQRGVPVGDRTANPARSRPTPLTGSPFAPSDDPRDIIIGPPAPARGVRHGVGAPHHPGCMCQACSVPSILAGSARLTTTNLSRSNTLVRGLLPSYVSSRVPITQWPPLLGGHTLCVYL